MTFIFRQTSSPPPRCRRPRARYRIHAHTHTPTGARAPARSYTRPTATGCPVYHSYRCVGNTRRWSRAASQCGFRYRTRNTSTAVRSRRVFSAGRYTREPKSQSHGCRRHPPGYIARAGIRNAATSAAVIFSSLLPGTHAKFQHGNELSLISNNNTKDQSLN